MTSQGQKWSHVEIGKFGFIRPPKPHISPPDPPDGPGAKKMAQITIIQSNGDISCQKINCRQGKKNRFFTRTDPYPTTCAVVHPNSVRVHVCISHLAPWCQ